MNRTSDPNSADAVTVVVAAYNGAKCIGACIESVLASAHPVRVVVVDNASEDDTRAIVARFPDVVCLPQEKNRGFGGANNIGIRHALDDRADFVFLLNQDACLEKEAIGTLVRAAREHPAFGILSPVHRDAAGGALDALFEEFLRTWYPETDNVSELLREPRVLPVPFVNAAAWLVTRECVTHVGGFDPLFFMRGEDNDYCNRARFHGFQVGVATDAAIRHDREVGTEANRPLARQSVKWRAGERKRQMIVALKHPGSRFARHLFWWAFGILREAVASIARMDYRGVFALAMASAAACWRLPRICSHRRTCIAGRMAWLQPLDAERPRSPT